MALDDAARALSGAGQRSPETEREYERRVRRFIEWARQRNLGTDWKGLLLAYEALSRDLKPASRRKYRAALRYWIERTEGFAAERMFSADAAVLDRKWRESIPKQTKKRRGGLLREMPFEVRQTTSMYLYGLGTVTGLIAGDLILATAVVGLRPGEWAGSGLEGDVLTVRNGKYREGVRGNGVERTLLLDRAKLSAGELEAVARLVLAMQGRSWAVLRVKVAPVLKDALRALVAQGLIERKWLRLRLYDARHQFAAEAKASMDESGGEVAAAMGHASAQTAVHHYGRRRKAQRPSAVRPSAESIAAVKPKTIERLARLNEKRNARAKVRSEVLAPTVTAGPKLEN